MGYSFFDSNKSPDTSLLEKAIETLSSPALLKLLSITIKDNKNKNSNVDIALLFIYEAQRLRKWDYIKVSWESEEFPK
jgi:hypothetical protein